MSDFEQTELNENSLHDGDSHRAELRVVSDRVSESYCTVLRKAREKKGLTDHDVARALHVSHSCIKALEEQRYDSLPEDTYVKGYIRSYAALVNLNPEGLIKDYLQDKHFRSLSKQQRLLLEQQEKEKARLEEEPAFDQKVHLFADKVIEFKNNYGVFLLIGLALFALILVSLQQYLGQDSQATPNLIDKVVVQGVDGSIVVSEFSDNPSLTPTVSVSPEQAALRANEDRLKMVFSDTSWVTIRDENNQLLHQSRETKGEVFQFTGKAPFYLRLSNAKAVTVSINGQDVDFSHALTDDGQLLEFQLSRTE